MDWSAFFRSDMEPVMAYQPGLREEQIRKLVEVNTIYKLSSNESPLPPFPSAIAAMTEKLLYLNEYPEGSSFDLKQVLALHYGLSEEQIIVGNGSNELIDLIAQTCLNKEDNVVFCWPSFVVYRSSAQLMGAQCRELPLAADGSFDLEAILENVDDHTKIVYLCTPNNPTGAVISHAALNDFLDRVPKHVLVMVDAAYEEFIDDPEAARPLEFFDGQRPYVVLRTFSKIYALAGIRCGYGLVPAELTKMIDKAREPFNVNSLAQASAQASLADVEELAYRKELNKKGRNQLQVFFDEQGIRYFPSQANFIWVEVANAAEAFEALLHKGIIVRAFPGTQGLRVGIGDEEGVAATKAAFRELLDTAVSSEQMRV